MQRERVHEASAVQHDAVPVGGITVQDAGHPEGGEVCDRHDVTDQGDDVKGVAQVSDVGVHDVNQV